MAFFGAVSCKEKEKTVATPPEEKTVVEKVADAVKEVVKPAPVTSLSDEERAAKLGFAKFLPKETEMVMSVYNSQKATDQLRALKLYGLLASEFGMDEMIPEDDGPILEDDILLEEAEQDQEDPDANAEADGEIMEEPSPWMLLGQEVTIAMGDNTGKQAANMLTLNRRMSYFQAKNLREDRQDGRFLG
jgi:hypothetical protein